MEVCQSQSSHHSSMSFLDQIFGTDGRKHKEDGVWNWIKHQRNKKSNKTLVGRSTNGGGDLKIIAGDESARLSSYPHQQYHVRSNSRSSNHSSSTAVTSHSYMCRTPTSPTSTFIPSYSSSFSSSSSSCPAVGSSSSSVTAISSSSPVTAAAGTLYQVNTTPTAAHVCPAGLQQQQPTAQSNFTLPGVSTPIAPLSSTVSSPRQRSTFSSASSASSLSYSAGYDQGMTIRRSASAGSAPSSRSRNNEMTRDYHQEQQRPRRQRWSSGAISFVSSRASTRIPEEGDEGEGIKNEEWWWE
ncbi:hypothetical protein EMPS_05225 [Entomortierella parvispora]|uniref:Uncharacterized protein n=1 Tax=Entomortierella parvispora TaxID=205924 RepID=A0A9P3HA19_9FUNG|nr:hypothetical protein EMPS_05225 [Entomortierella parvispora]